MSSFDRPFEINDQIESIKKYIVLSENTKIDELLSYSGYFRISRYGKYLISHTNVLKNKPDEKLLFKVYEFDVELRRLLFFYSKRAEIQFKSHLSNSVSLKIKEPTFYLDDKNYTPTRSEKDKIKRNSNKKYYNKFKQSIGESEKKLRMNVNKYPEFKEYRTGGERENSKLPCWAAFSYFEFGSITNIYSYLNGGLRKEVLRYGYSRKKYGKEDTKNMDTWLDAIRNLRNLCAHHNKVVGKTSSIVLLDKADDEKLLPNNTDLFSRIYALKKVLNRKDIYRLKSDLKKLIDGTDVDIYKFEILSEDWETLFDEIKMF